jgi:hypothetical protein
MLLTTVYVPTTVGYSDLQVSPTETERHRGGQGLLAIGPEGLEDKTRCVLDRAGVERLREILDEALA